MKREIMQEELEIIKSNYSDEEKMINIYKDFIDYTNSSRFKFKYPGDLNLSFFEKERFECYKDGIIEDMDLEIFDDDLDFAIEITSEYLSSNTLIKFYSFAVKNDFDLRVLNGEEKIFIYFRKISNKKERKGNKSSKQYLLGKYALGKIYSYDKFEFYPKNVKLYFENMIERINYRYSALLIKNHFNQIFIDDIIGEYEENIYSGILDKMNKSYLQNSSIFNYLQPIIDAERGLRWKYLGDIDNDFYDIEDDECREIERTDESKIENFIVSFIENNGHVNGSLYRDSYKKMISRPLPFQMIDYQYLSQNEYEDKIIYTYRLSTFLDPYILHLLFVLYYIMQLYPDIKVKFFIKPIKGNINKGDDDSLKTTTCNNLYLRKLFDLLCNTNDAYNNYYYGFYNYNEEYINFFFYIIESKNKKTLDSDSYFAELEKLKRQDELNREAIAQEEEYKRENENFIKSMNEDFPGWYSNID